MPAATLISIRVHPGAKKSEITGFSGEMWQAKVAAPPVKGKANAELIALLSQILGVSKSDISIVRGNTSRSKVIAVSGLSEEEVRRRLASSVASSK